MARRTVEMVMSPREPHYVGDGFRVHNFIPSGYGLDMARMSPFLVLDYNSEFYFPPSDTPRGVNVHPHRGFETVTIAYQGSVQHHDSSGGGGIIHQGDVQWMTAASGVLHKEYHESTWSKKGGLFQMVQLWVNLPAKDKKSSPKYQTIQNKDIKRYYLDNNTGEIEIIAGQYNDIQGNASTFTPVNLMNAKLLKGAKAEFSFPKNYNTAMLVIKGGILINDSEKVATDNFILMHNDGETFNIEATQDAIVLVMSGEPIIEPIAAHGPFVMNTRAEIEEAFRDYNNGKFGYLEEEIEIGH